MTLLAFGTEPWFAGQARTVLAANAASRTTCEPSNPISTPVKLVDIFFFLVGDIVRSCGYRSGDFDDLILALLHYLRSHLSSRTAVWARRRMSRKRNIFTTYGTLRVNVHEALDLVDNVNTGPKRFKVSKSNVFAVLRLVNESGGDVLHFNSETHPFYASESLMVGEEFIFENASSAYGLVVAFYLLSLEKEKNQSNVFATQSCLGYTKIPLSRLEENVSVIQWYIALQQHPSLNSSSGLHHTDNTVAPAAEFSR
jgi:hypothetical protein